MGRKKTDATPKAKTEAVKTEEVKVEEVKTEEATAGAAEETTEDEKAAIYAEIETLVSKYNEHAKYGELKSMKEIDEKIASKVQEYDQAAEKEAFDEFLKAENPMKAAAEAVRYSTVKVADEKGVQKGVIANKVIEASSKPIDPLRLHKRVSGGIGADKSWHFMIEKLNLLLTCRRAIELGVDPREIQNTYSMSEEAAKIEVLLSETDPTKYDKNKADEVLKQDVQKCVDAMLGTGFSVSDVMCNYLLMIYTKKDNRKALSVTCANHRYMRTYLLEICHAAITGNAFSLNYKAKK